MAKKKTENHADRAHALLSASGASRWLNCTASPRLEENFEDTTSVFAEEGTLAHEIAELGLLVQYKRISKEEYKKRDVELEKSEHYSKDMLDEVFKYLNYVIEQYGFAKKKTKYAELLIEEKVDLTDYIENGFGTCDSNIISDGTLEIIDLKYGKGIKVSAVDNSQLKLYGLGALEKYDMIYDIHTVKLTIVQPRLDNISSWEISAEELKNWGENFVKPKAVEAYAGAGEAHAGSWCHFCKAKVRCRALTEQNLAVAKLEFQDPSLLSDTELLEAYKKMPQIASWLKTVSEYLLEEAKKGKIWEGYKLVEGKSHRKWSNEEEVKNTLSAIYKEGEYLNTKLKGIGDIEKLVTKKTFSKLLGDFVVKPAGAPTLVEVSDKRTAIGIAQAREDFKK